MAAPLKVQPVGMRVAHHLVGPPVLARLRCEITGAARVPGAGGVLLAANHRSFLDHFLLAAASPRPMRFLGKTELAEGVFGRFNVAMGMIPLDRGTADLATLDVVARLLRAGAVIGVFPEGTRSPTGELHRFRSGLARIAATAQKPTVPVGLLGTAQVWPRKERPHLSRPAPGVLHVRFGEVIAAPSGNGRDRRMFTTAVHDAVAALCEQPLADTFAPVAGGPGRSAIPT